MSGFECPFCWYYGEFDENVEGERICKICGHNENGIVEEEQYSDYSPCRKKTKLTADSPPTPKVVPIEKLIVPRLKDIAFRVSFKEILNNLVLCHEHRPEEKQVMPVAFSSLLSLSQLCTSQCLINLMRNRLDQFLVEAKMNAEMRMKYVGTFYSSFSTGINLVDPWVFLDCVLNSTFEELETHVAFPDSEPNSKLVSSIAKRASLLQKLKLDFSFMKKTTRVEKVAPLITSLSSLQHLTSLNLYQLNSSHKSVLKLIGNACPRLSHLSVSGFRLTPKDVLSIVLGGFADELFLPNSETYLWDEELNLGTVKAPVEVLTPICLSLRHLQFEDADLDVNLDDCRTVVSSFLLRHLSLLEKMDGHSTSFGIALMNDGTSWMKEKNSQEKFEMACKKFIASGLPGALSHSSENVILKYPEFKGSLSLTTLDLVYFTPSLLLTIPKFCPNLKEVVFYEQEKENLGRGRFIEEMVPPNDVVDHFKTWPKLKAITFNGISPEYVEAVLKYFAPSLKSVNFISCHNIIWMNLIDCLQLESLSISKGSISMDTSSNDYRDFVRLSPDSFLPHLKSFESQICLGRSTLWLKGKSELTHVVINCFHHYETNEGCYIIDWLSIPKLWPKLETLVIWRCYKLTMPRLAIIVPQLKNLKKLSLPATTTMDESKLAVDIWEDLNYRSASVHFSLTESYGADYCVLDLCRDM